jgi:hypothetical protein
MEQMNRRAAITLGLAVVAAPPLVGLTTPAAADMYGPEGHVEALSRIVILGRADSRRSIDRGQQS